MDDFSVFHNDTARIRDGFLLRRREDTVTVTFSQWATAIRTLLLRRRDLVPVIELRVSLS